MIMNNPLDTLRQLQGLTGAVNEQPKTLQELTDRLDELERLIADDRASVQEMAEYRQKLQEYEQEISKRTAGFIQGGSLRHAQRDDPQKRLSADVTGLVETTRFYNDQVKSLNAVARGIGLKPSMTPEERKAIIAEHPDYERASRDLIALGRFIVSQHEKIGRDMMQMNRQHDVRDAARLYAEHHADGSFRAETPDNPPDHLSDPLTELLRRIEETIRNLVDRFANLFRDRGHEGNELN